MRFTWAAQLAVSSITLLMHMYLVLHKSTIVNSGAVLEDGGNQFSAAPASLELGRNTTEAATTASPLAVQQINNFNFTVGICMVMKDAEAYFEEWIDYHVGVMKFDAIYIYDNSPDFELRNWYRNSRNDPVYGKVEVMHYKSTRKDNWNEKEGGYDQNVIYRDCNDRFGKKGPRHDYLAFIDIDEFLVPQKKAVKSTTTGEEDSTTTTATTTAGSTSIHGILDEYLVPYGGALTVNWLLFGTANKTAYSPFPVTKRFQYRDAKTHNVIKSIVKSSDYDGHINPHGVNLSNGAKIRTTKKPGFVYDAKSDAKASDHKRPSDVLLLYHYRYTSTKEYIFKRCVRGNIDPNYWCNKEGTGIKEIPHGREHILPRPGAVYDDTAWTLLTQHVPKYRLFDSYGWKDYM